MFSEQVSIALFAFHGIPYTINANKRITNNNISIDIPYTTNTNKKNNKK